MAINGRSSAPVYYSECKPKDKKMGVGGGRLGTRLIMGFEIVVHRVRHI